MIDFVEQTVRQTCGENHRKCCAAGAGTGCVQADG
jgi:hypothetical protein